LASLILLYHQEILNLVWTRPESPWILWLWHILSWLLSLALVGISAVLSYLISQILFSVIIMDSMSRMTERKIKGHVKEAKKVTLWHLFFYLVRQEIPRAILPVLLFFLIMLLGWLTPLGPVLTVLSSCMAAIFLAWDNTDLVPARRLVPFRERLGLLGRSIPLHLGFGLPFLVPGLNILFLSFGPVGGTIFHLERQEKQEAGSEKPVK
jgi:CysZ protein